MTNCQQCKGEGHHHAKIMNLGTKQIEDHIVICLNPTCKNGKVDPELSKAYHEGWRVWGAITSQPSPVR